MIRVTSGTCNTDLGLKRASDGPFTLNEAAEQRLVNRGVAVYVGEHHERAVATPAVHAENDIPANIEADNACEEVPAEGDSCPQEELHTKAQLESFTRQKLDELAAEMGIDSKKCKTKADVISLILDFEAQAGEDDGSPYFGGEDE